MNQATLHATEKDRRPLVLASIVLGMFMAAIEGTIVATAIPDIVGDLGGFSHYSWVFSAYLLMNALTILIYGKLADLYGRKPVYLFGVIVFLIGSLLAGFAQSMGMLILFRVIQGLGAGAVQPIAMTMVGDLYTLEERGRIQGYLSSVWGISAIIGPALGGLFVEYLNWSWVFWMNVPIGLLSMAGIACFFRENVAVKKHAIDYLGAFLCFLAIAALMILLIQGGTVWPWLSPPVFGCASVFVVAFLLFLWRERRAKEPVVPLNLWKNPLIVVANIVNLTTGIVIIGLTSFLPSYVQGVMGRSALVAGFTLTAMSIGWPLAATVVGRLLARHDHRKIAVTGGVALIVGGFFFLTLHAEKGPLWAALGSFLIGVGMGSTTTTFIVAIQSSVGWQLRGAATSSNMFMRMLGSATGAALLGGLLNMRLKAFIHEHRGREPLSLDSANALLENRTVHVSGHGLKVLKAGLESGLHAVYIGVFAFAVLSFLLILLIPRKAMGEAKAGQ
ncbi:MDR family MFS transporter [Caenibacillus caldisaponilyticus]|uniref:MDR family MFS transporter n=1 Tax=Caenibacillus caldisaponilyticus TaxID=1674942 RepID=UPI00098851B7|nr:MDR family MFS transporter [Caenibacillus caldisaponilyticus]